MRRAEIEITIHDAEHRVLDVWSFDVPFPAHVDASDEPAIIAGLTGAYSARYAGVPMSNKIVTGVWVSVETAVYDTHPALDTDDTYYRDIIDTRSNIRTMVNVTVSVTPSVFGPDTFTFELPSYVQTESDVDVSNRIHTRLCDILSHSAPLDAGQTASFVAGVSYPDGNVAWYAGDIPPDYFDA